MDGMGSVLEAAARFVRLGNLADGLRRLSEEALAGAGSEGSEEEELPDGPDIRFAKVRVNAV